MARIEFCGGSGSVTGSCYRLVINDRVLLVDCGLFQERDFLARNWDPFPFNVRDTDAVVITHSHIDHIGRLPLLARQGYSGPIYSHSASCDLAELMLLDAAHIQEEDARFKTKRHRREGRAMTPTEPLYTVADAEQCLRDLRPVQYDQRIEVLDGIYATWRDAGHILGSAHVKLEWTEQGQARNMVFSGDIGVKDRVILRDPQPFDQADFVVCESTYGDRLHEPSEMTSVRLRQVVLEALRRGGNLVVPAFAVGRTQALLYHLRGLIDTKQIPPVMTFVDSPMAVEATKITYAHPECFDEEARQLYDQGKDPVGYRDVKYSTSVDQSKAINNIRGSAIIISASGMATAGRIKHHLQQNLPREESTVLFTGFQAEGTLGRQLVDGARQVRLFGRQVPVRAHIERIDSLSGHADQQGMLEWLGAIQNRPRQAFITHGERSVADGFASLVGEKLGWEVSAPEYGDRVEF